MLHDKVGLNQYSVFVRGDHFDSPPIKCQWIGHERFKCGGCKKGYFNVADSNSHDEKCPDCSRRVSVRYDWVN